MALTPGLRKFALTAHVTFSVGSLGAVAGFLALAIAGLTSRDEQTVRAAYLAMELTARFVIVPLILASLLTGLVQSLGTAWGLFRHYWVLVKFLLTILVTIVLLLQLNLISHVSEAAAGMTWSSIDLRQGRTSLLIHAAGGLLVLLIPVALSLYKPQGMTRYGSRKQQERRPMSQRDDAGVRSGPGSAIRPPRWVFVFSMVTVVVLLLVVTLLVGLGHGSCVPSRFGCPTYVRPLSARKRIVSRSPSRRAIMRAMIRRSSTR